MKILDGKKLTEKVLDELKQKIGGLRKPLKLAVVLVGDDQPSVNYINQKEKICRVLGIDFKLYKYSTAIKTEDLEAEIKNISKDDSVSGMIVQLPLPGHIDTAVILNAVPAKKDPDVLSEVGSSKFFNGDFALIPPAAAGIVRFFEEYKIKIKGKRAIVIGSGKLIGRPMAFWLMSNKATVTILNSRTKDISEFTKKADIIICGAGKAGMIRGSMIKKGAVIIDAGSNYKNGKIFGDVDFKTVSKKAGYITPVPGGVGPMTVAMLLENLVKLNS